MMLSFKPLEKRWRVFMVSSIRSCQPAETQESQPQRRSAKMQNFFFFLLKRCENNRLNWLTDQRVALKRHFGQGQLLNKAAHWRTIKNTMRLRQHRPRRLLGCFVSCNKSLTCRSHQLSTKTPTEKKSIILIWSQNNVQILFISFQIVSAYLYCFLSWIWK